MATISQVPVNIIAGQTVPVLDKTQSTPYGTIVCTVYNSTSSVLAVTCSGGTRLLQPLQADSYPCSSALQVPTVAPITFQASGTYLGIVLSTFYDKNDGAPPGFPMPLSPFPGGEQQIAVVMPLLPAGTTLAVPPGTTSLVFVNPGPSQGAILSVVGAQSGINYLTTSTAVTPAGGMVTVPVAALDTAYVIKPTIISPWLNATVYASDVPTSAFSGSAAPSALPIPTMATLSVTASASTATLLPAPSSGAYYLFDWDVEATVLTGIAELIDQAVAKVFATVQPPVNNSTVNARLRYRVAGALGLTASSTTIWLRYALGP